MFGQLLLRWLNDRTNGAWCLPRGGDPTKVTQVQPWGQLQLPFFFLRRKKSFRVWVCCCVPSDNLLSLCVRNFLTNLHLDLLLCINSHGVMAGTVHCTKSKFRKQKHQRSTVKKCGIWCGTISWCCSGLCIVLFQVVLKNVCNAML